MGNIIHAIEQLVGNTPLMELHHFQDANDVGAHILAKLEFLNPSGSVKDRAALSMIIDAEKRGFIKPGSVLVEQTSGNTGIALASIAAARGYKLEIFLERGASLERRQLLQAYGATLLDYRDACGIRPMAEKMHPWEEPDREATLAEIYAYCEQNGGHFLNQVTNAANPEAHYRTTGPEIWSATEGKVDVFVCMAGTGGTGFGTSKYLREQNREMKVVLVQPHPNSRLGPANVKGNIIDGVLPAYGVGEEDLSDYLNTGWSDEYLEISTDQAYETAREVLRTEGLLLGTSAAAALRGAAEVGKRPEYKGKNIVVIIPDNGMKYLSTPMYKEGTDT